MTLTPAMREFLDEPRFAVLATLFADGSIQQTVMWYELRDDDTIIVNTSAGRAKERNVRRDPRVSLCLEEHYQYLTIQGHVTEIIEDQEIAQADIFGLARRYNPGISDDEIDQRFANFRQEHRETIVIGIDNVIANGF